MMSDVDGDWMVPGKDTKPDPIFKMIVAYQRIKKENEELQEAKQIIKFICESIPYGESKSCPFCEWCKKKYKQECNRRKKDARD